MPKVDLDDQFPGVNSSWICVGRLASEFDLTDAMTIQDCR